MKSRLWCFTNYDLKFDYLPLMNEKAKYIIIGREVCPTTNRPHDQGFIYYNNQRASTKAVAKELGKCHVEMCKGTLEQNCNYCSKDSNVREFGTKPDQGARSDLKCVLNELQIGSTSVDDLVISDPLLYHQYGRTLERAEDIFLRKKFRTRMTECDWIVGPTGTGKSHKAFENFNPETHYVYPNDNGWWDGYKGHPIVIINEFRGQIQYAELLDLIDKWPKTVKRRNREPVPFLAEKIIITSSLRPEEIYYNLHEKDKLAQLYRRVKILAQKCSEGNTGTSEQDLDDPE